MTNFKAPFLYTIPMNIKRLSVLFILFSTSVSLVFGQSNVEDIEKYIEQARIDWNVPGMSVAIVKDGKIISNRGYGYLKYGGKQKVDENSLFAIASNTKAFVSSAIGVLQQEGKLDFDDKVQAYIPEFQLYDAYASSEATIRDLLCHRLGLGTYSGDVIWYKSDFTAREVIGKIKYVPQKYSFRSGYGYSNLMFITAGEVIREVSGMSWDGFVRDRFLEPLSMNRTITSTKDLRSLGNFAIPHKPVEEKNISIDWVNWDNMGAAGGIISSSNDMANWLLFQLNNGIWENDTILAPSIQNILWTTHNSYTVSLAAIQRNPGTNFSGYGLGWGVSDYYGNRMITHGGGYDGMYSQVVLLPELDLGIVILTNTMKSIATPLRYFIINSFFEKEQKDWSQEALARSNRKGAVEKQIEEIKSAREFDTKPTQDLADYAGIYHTDMHGPIHIVTDGDELYLNFENAPDLTARLDHWHYDTWEIKWDNVHAWFDFGILQFKLNSELKITGLEFDIPNYDIFFHELNTTKID